MPFRGKQSSITTSTVRRNGFGRRSLTDRGKARVLVFADDFDEREAPRAGA